MSYIYHSGLSCWSSNWVYSYHWAVDFRSGYCCVIGNPAISRSKGFNRCYRSLHWSRGI